MVTQYLTRFKKICFLSSCILLFNIASVLSNGFLSTYSGISHFDLFGTGVDNFLSVGYQAPLLQKVSLEITATYFLAHQQMNRNRPFLIPELGLTYRSRFLMMEPFIGGGGGIAIDIRSKKKRNEPSVLTESYWLIDDYVYTRTVYFGHDRLVEPSFFANLGVLFPVQPNVMVGVQSKLRALDFAFGAGDLIWENGLIVKIKLGRKGDLE